MSASTPDSTQYLLQTLIVRLSDSREALNREADRLAAMELELRKLLAATDRPLAVAAPTTPVDVEPDEVSTPAVSHDEAIRQVLQHIETVNSTTGAPAPYPEIYDVLGTVGKSGKTLSGLATKGLIAMNASEEFAITPAGRARLRELSGA